MPIDTSVYRILQPPRISNPYEAVQQVLQGQKLASELRVLRQQEQDDAAIRQILTETGGDVEKALPKLRTIAPSAALTFETEIAKHRKEAALGLKAQTEAEIERTNRSLQLFRGVSEQTYGPFYANLQKSDPEVAALLPPTWDADAVERVHRIGLSAKDALEEHRRSFTLAAGGNPREALATYFKNADTEAEWNEGLTKWAAIPGMPRELLALVGPWDPEAPKRVGSQLGITPMQAETLAGQEAARAEAARQHAAQQAHQAAQLEVSRGHLAVAQAAERRQAAAPGEGGAVKLTAAQQEDIATMLTVEQLANDVIQIGKEKGEFPGVGPSPFGGGTFFASARGSGGTTGETLRNKIGNIQGTIAKLRGGTSFTPGEQKLLDSYTPTLTDTDHAIRTKLANLTDFIQKKRANTLRVAAGQYTLPETPKPPTPDEKTKDPLGIR